MSASSRLLRAVAALFWCAALAACGGGDGGSSASGSSSSGGTVITPAANVQPIVVDSGPNGNAANTLYTSVTLCVPGSTTQCQTIDHIQVDTGSYGLRLLASVSALALPIQQFSDGTTLLECTQFVDGYSWGPVALADLQISGETASSVPVQIIGDPGYTNVPGDCSGTGTAENTVAEFGANGIIGIGVFAEDCGAYCANNVDAGFYYACSQTACDATMVDTDHQVLNPVPLFAKDNNGTIIVLPSVADGGVATLTGSLIFGIDTQTNNASGSETALTVDDSSGNFSVKFNGVTLADSFIDSGSNAYYFNDSALTQCTDTNYTGFYCPSSTQSLSAVLTGNNNATATVDFKIANAQTLVSNGPAFTVFPTLGGTYPSADSTFDFGLPFFYGRKVFNALEQHSTSKGSGPYVAF